MGFIYPPLVSIDTMDNIDNERESAKKRSFPYPCGIPPSFLSYIVQ